MKLRFRALAALTACAGMIIAGALAVGPASADPVSAPVCSSAGTALQGSYGNLTVTGNAYVAAGATLTVNGNLTVARGACLDAFSTGTVHVAGNVQVRQGAVLGLGCAPFANGAFEPCGYTTTDDTVGGNLTADQPLTMYLTAVTVQGNLTSHGGGPGADTPSSVSFPIKQMTVRGNLVVTGWQGGTTGNGTTAGGWFGALGNTIGGNAIISQNSGSRPGDSGAPDSTEVLGNTVGGNLICVHNTPAAQYGDAIHDPTLQPFNTVSGNAIGECAGLTTPPNN